MEKSRLAIGIKRDEFKWKITYGDAAFVERWIIMNAADREARVYGELFKEEEKMMKQIEYYKNEFPNAEIHKVTDVLRETA